VCSLIDFPWLLQARPVNALRKNLKALPKKEKDHQKKKKGSEAVRVSTK
jgi:hypothetical protein